MDFSTPTQAFFDYISANIKSDPKTLRLKAYGKEMGLNTDFAITQIECRQRAAHKLPAFMSNPHTLFPSTLSYEQASHESVAKFHALLIPQESSVIDMTAGLGIDSMSFARHGCHVTACETDPLKYETLKYNANILGLENLTAINADSTEYIRSIPNKVDVIFIDPARRSASDRRLYNMHDCTPDVLSLMDTLLSKCDILLIKASPLLDISQTLKDIPQAKKIWAVSVDGECKEVLVMAVKGAAQQSLEAVDLAEDGGINYCFSYSPTDSYGKIAYASEDDVKPGAYLYEPGAAIMKLTPWDALHAYSPELKKLSVSSHLFVSPNLLEGFPGRKLRIEAVIDKKSRKTLKGFPANVVTRNYPLGADELRKKLGVKEGKDDFIYASRLSNTPILLRCVRI